VEYVGVGVAGDAGDAVLHCPQNNLLVKKSISVSSFSEKYEL
jgi:hypothetical protein